VSQTANGQVEITNKLGLHARPAMLFRETAARYESDIRVSRSDDTTVVNGKSVMELLMLAATCGTVIKISADGEDAPDAVSQLIELVKSNFSEE
jgi:phosphocarrier protein